jgi:hypothetical protein
VYFVDNSYGKLSRFRDCWLRDDPRVRQMATFGEAVRQAQQDIGHGGPTSNDEVRNSAARAC